DRLDVDDLTDGLVSVLVDDLTCRRRQSRRPRGRGRPVAQPDRRGDHARVTGLQFRVERFRPMCHDEYLLYSAGEAGGQGLVSWSPALRFAGQRSTTGRLMSR